MNYITVFFNDQKTEKYSFSSENEIALQIFNNFCIVNQPKWAMLINEQTGVVETNFNEKKQTQENKEEFIQQELFFLEVENNIVMETEDWANDGNIKPFVPFPKHKSSTSITNSSAYINQKNSTNCVIPLNDQNFKLPLIKLDKKFNSFEFNKDLILTIISYDFPNKTIICQNDNGNLYKVKVSDKTIYEKEKEIRDNCININYINFLAHKIDDKMARYWIPGMKIVAHNIALKNIDQQGFAFIEAENLVNVSDPEQEKCFQTIISVQKAYNKEQEDFPFSVLSWSDTAININDVEAINQVFKNIDASTKNYFKDVQGYCSMGPTVGIQFRAILQIENEFKVINFSELYTLPYFLSKGEKFDSLKAKQLKDSYIQEINEEFTPKDLNLSKMLAEYRDNIHIDMCVANVYPYSKVNQMYSDGDSYEPVSIHSLNFNNFCKLENTGLGMIGIVLLPSDNLANINGKPMLIEKNYIKEVVSSNNKYHLYNLISTVNNGGNVSKVSF